MQRIHVRTSQKCPRCKDKFKDVGNNLVCPRCQTVATRMFLEWWVDNKRYYRSGFDSYTDALRKAIKIEIDIRKNFVMQRLMQQIHRRRQMKNMRPHNRARQYRDQIQP